MGWAVEGLAYFAVGEALRQCHGLAFWDSKLYTNTLGAALQP